jgi:FKBP-type peptidyl-prolyl cis-trans isomerase FkpA
MNKLLVLLLTILSLSSAYAGEAPSTEEQKTLYAIGQTVFRSLAVFNLSAAEFEIVKQGIIDAHAGVASSTDPTTYSQKIQELAKARRKAAGERQAAAGKKYLETVAKEKGAHLTKSGLVYLPLAEGSGNSPRATDNVKVHYRGTLIDGTEFDSSHKRGKPLDFKLDGVIKCWTEGLQLMRPGGKARLFCPPQLAYGENGAGELILPNATLAFEVELLEVKSSVVPTFPGNKPVQAAPTPVGPRVGSQPGAPGAKK